MCMQIGENIKILDGVPIQLLALPVLGRLLVLLRPQRGWPSVQAFLIPAAIKFKLDQVHHEIVLYPLLLT